MFIACTHNIHMREGDKRDKASEIPKFNLISLYNVTCMYALMADQLVTG